MEERTRKAELGGPFSTLALHSSGCARASILAAGEWVVARARQ